MFSLEQLRDGVLNRFTIQVPVGTTLFKQNDKGNTLYVIIEGSVKLTHKLQNMERIITTLGPGEIVGEKALLAVPYRRAFTAIAETDVTALEFDGQSLKAIAAKAPDFSLKLLQIVILRLDRANGLIAALQTQNPIERVANYLNFLCLHQSKASPSGVEIETTADLIQMATCVPIEVIRDCLDELEGEKILIKKGNGYQVPDPSALGQHTTAMKERIAA
ncbi:Crp/Fnr family transcriptional regulator [bacterium]|nr:Crp/Fnr family transcriptional regulator [bacterium]